MKKYATLNKDQDIIGIHASFDDAMNAGKKNKNVAYIRPVCIEDDDDYAVEFGNCYAYAVK